MTFALALSLLGAAPQDDRARILEKVEAWYQVVQEGKNVGYAHEKLERMRDEWRYAYQTDFEIKVKGGWHQEYRDIEATLDSEMVPASLSAKIEAGEAGATFTVATEGEKRTLLFRDRREPVATEVYTLPTLLFYSLRQSGKLAQEGPRSARILNPRAQGRIDSEISFRAGALLRREFAGKRGPVTPITFEKSPPSANREAEWAEALVDKYGRLIEIAMRGGAKLVLVKDDLAAFREAVNPHRFPGRDPWDKKGAFDAAKSPSTPSPEAPKPRKVTEDNLLSTFESARALLDEMQARKGEGRTNDVVDSYFKLVGTWKALREKSEGLGRPDLVAQADDLRDRAETIWNGAAQARDAASQAFWRAAQALERADVPSLERELRSLREARSRPELERRPELREVLSWIVRTEPMLARARTRAQLAKMELVVTGTLLASRSDPISVELVAGVTETVPFVRDLSTAAINGKTYRAGDAIEGGTVLIDKISAHSVTVSMRGELREIPIGGK